MGPRRKRKKYVSHTNPPEPKGRGRLLTKLLGEKHPDHLARFYDYKLLITVIILCCFGLIMVYSSSAYTATDAKYGSDEFRFLKNEALYMGIGIIAMLLISKVDYHFYPGWLIWLSYIGTTALVAVVNFTPLGVAVNGQKRWLNVIPGVRSTPTYQPSELVKIALILLMAMMINYWFKYLNTIPICFYLVVLAAIPAGLVAMKNLSTGIIIMLIAAMMYLVAGRWKWIYLVGFPGIVAVVAGIYYNPDFLLKIPVVKNLIGGYRIERIKIWKDPASDALDRGYQSLQALYAIGSGGWFGKGLGNSLQKIDKIPESYNDMIFSIICEELGLFGAICVLALFGYLIYRCFYIALLASDLFGCMIVVGVAMQISIQVLLNVCVVTNVLPNTGVTLPFISYGGTAVAILLAEMGLVLSVSNQIVYEKQ